MSPRRIRLVSVFLLAVSLVIGGAPAGAVADEVLAWNVTALEAAGAGGQNNIVITRTLAMVHLAIHDALNSISRRYEPYVQHGRAEPGADPAAASTCSATSRERDESGG